MQMKLATNKNYNQKPNKLDKTNKLNKQNLRVNKTRQVKTVHSV